MSSTSPVSTDYSVSVSPEHEAYRKVVKEFADKVVAPQASRIDKENQMDVSIIRKAGEIGLLGIPFPEEFGGAGADDLTLAIAIEELTKASAACAAAISANYLVSTPLYLYGNDLQKKKYLGRLAKGEILGAHAMTEPGAGSDVAGIKTRAEKKGERYYISGRKVFITNGDKADVFLVFARTSPPEPGRRHRGITAFLLEKGAPGFKIGERLQVIGLRGEHPVELIFDGVEVGEESVVGEVGRGVRIALNTYDHGRIGVAAQGVGLAQAALEQALKYSVQRQTFDNYLLSYQQVQFKLAEMAAAAHTSRLLTYWAATLASRGLDFVKAASIAKITATESAEKNAHMAMLIMGAYGVSTEMGAERLLRDSQVIKTYEGTNDIQRLTIAKELAKELGVLPSAGQAN